MNPIVIHKHDITESTGDRPTTPIRVICVMRNSAKLLSVALQFNRIMVWEAHDYRDTELREQEFVLVMTGDPTPLPDGAQFFGTVQLPSQNPQTPWDVFVLHIFVLPGRKLNRELLSGRSVLKDRKEEEVAA